MRLKRLFVAIVAAALLSSSALTLISATAWADNEESQAVMDPDIAQCLERLKFMSRLEKASLLLQGEIKRIDERRERRRRLARRLSLIGFAIAFGGSLVQEGIQSFQVRQIQQISWFEIQNSNEVDALIDRAGQTSNDQIRTAIFQKISEHMGQLDSKETSNLLALAFRSESAIDRYNCLVLVQKSSFTTDQINLLQVMASYDPDPRIRSLASFLMFQTTLREIPRISFTDPSK